MISSVYTTVVNRAERFSADTWDEIERLAEELKNRAVLPVIGAGGSIGCGSKSAATLADELYQRATTDLIPPESRPSDLGTLKSDLGKMADALCLEVSPTVMLDALGFRDEVCWPGYAVGAVVSWRISFRASGPVGAAGSLPTRTTEASAVYPVSEARAFLVGGGSQ